MEEKKKDLKIGNISVNIMLNEFVPKLFLLPLLLLVLATTAHGAEPSKTQGINQQFLKAIISIEILTKPDKADPIGTGFFINTADGKTGLVTAKHVIAKEDGEIKGNLGYRVNTKNGDSILITEREMSTNFGGWFLSSSDDVGFRYFGHSKKLDSLFFPYEMLLSQENVQTGAHILVLGFPLGLRSKKYTVPIVRGGIVAFSDRNNFLIDAFAFPGNSGGPVVYAPTLKVKGQGISLSYLDDEKIIGIVSQQISYREPAISPKTGRPRVIFEDNAGLSIVVPIDALIELLKQDSVIELGKKLERHRYRLSF